MRIFITCRIPFFIPKKFLVLKEMKCAKYWQKKILFWRTYIVQNINIMSNEEMMNIEYCDNLENEFPTFVQKFKIDRHDEKSNKIEGWLI